MGEVGHYCAISKINWCLELRPPDYDPQEEIRWHRDGPGVGYVRTGTGSVTVRAQIAWPAYVVTQLGSVGRASHETQAKGCG